MNKISFTSKERVKILLTGITPFISIFILMIIVDSLFPTLLKTYPQITAFVFISSLAFIIFSLKFSYTKFNPTEVSDRIQVVKRFKKNGNIFLIISTIVNIPVLIFVYYSKEILSTIERNFNYSTYKQITYFIALLIEPFTIFFLISVSVVYIITFMYMKDFFLKYQLDKIKSKLY